MHAIIVTLYIAYLSIFTHADMILRYLREKMSKAYKKQNEQQAEEVNVSARSLYANIFITKSTARINPIHKMEEIHVVISDYVCSVSPPLAPLCTAMQNNGRDCIQNTHSCIYGTASSKNHPRG